MNKMLNPFLSTCIFVCRSTAFRVRFNNFVQPTKYTDSYSTGQHILAYKFLENMLEKLVGHDLFGPTCIEFLPTF